MFRGWGKDNFNNFRCGPCERIAPVFESLARKYPRAVFLKVDVDECQETAQQQGVTAMPTFIFFRNKVLLIVNHKSDALYPVCTVW